MKQINFLLGGTLGAVFLTFYSPFAIAQSDFTSEELRLNGFSAGHPPVFASVFTGAKDSYRILQRDAGENGSIGTFIRPSLEYRAHEPESYHFDAKYQFSAVAEQMYGDNQRASEDFTDNAVFTHTASMSSSVFLMPELSAIMSGIFGITSHHGDSTKNTMTVFLSPGVEYHFDKRKSLAVSFIYERLANFDTTMQEMMDASHGLDTTAAGALKAAPGGTDTTPAPTEHHHHGDPASTPATGTPATGSADTSDPNAPSGPAYPGQTPIRTLTAMQIAGKFAIDETTHFKVGVLTGQNSSNNALSEGSYRNALRLDLDSRFMKLKYKTMYQLTSDVRSFKSGRVSYNNALRLMFSYPLVNHWSLNLENNLGYMMGASSHRASSSNERAKFQQEQYLGVAYAF